jgi:hypothetical protein
MRYGFVGGPEHAGVVTISEPSFGPTHYIIGSNSAPDRDQ